MNARMRKARQVWTAWMRGRLYGSIFFLYNGGHYHRMGMEDINEKAGNVKADKEDVLKQSARDDAETADEVTGRPQLVPDEGTAEVTEGTSRGRLDGEQTESREEGQQDPGLHLQKAGEESAEENRKEGDTAALQDAGQGEGSEAGRSGEEDSAALQDAGQGEGSEAGRSGEEDGADLQKAGQGQGTTQGQSQKGSKKKGSRNRKAFWISLLAVCAILAGIYAAGYQYCSRHFMPGTLINGYDCGGLTEEEAEEIFAAAAKDYVLNIRFRGGTTEMLTASDMGFVYKPDGNVAKLLQEQDRLLWPRYLFESWSYTIHPGGDYDPEKLTKALQALPELQEENMEAPQDASIHFQSGEGDEDGHFVIVPDTEGSTLDLVQLSAGVGDAAAQYSELVDVEEIAGAYVSADVQADNAKLVSRCEDLNETVGASITYILPDGDTMKLNADIMKDWLVKDKNGRLVKDDDVWDEKLWAFLEQLAINSNTLGMSRQFHSSRRGTITVSGGDYGYMVNQITEHDKLVKDLPACKKETRKPDYYLTPYNEETENDGIGTTYIEADLSAQHVWCYVNGSLVMESDCVSGDTTDGHGTPTGVFGIMFMKKDTTLRGVMQANGKYEYETKVGYWMPFYDGCGFHDAWWRSAFGGTIYQGDGSHGCINLPVSAAETLFSYCDDKMPVVVYY